LELRSPFQLISTFQEKKPICWKENKGEKLTDWSRRPSWRGRRAAGVQLLSPSPLPPAGTPFVCTQEPCSIDLQYRGTRVSDLYHLDADPDSTNHPDADPDPPDHFDVDPDADPDSCFLIDADADSDPEHC
jgi:hypothetical protein